MIYNIANLIDFVISLSVGSHVPSQNVPLPWKPCLHMQVYPPALFLHDALAWQLWTLSAHSSISWKKIECKKVHITYQFEFWFDYWTFILTEALCSITMETILTRTDVSTNSVIACGIHVTIMLVRITFVNVLKIINRKQNLIYQNSLSFRKFCSIIFIMQQNVHTYRSTVCHFHGNHLYTCRCVHQ